MNIQLISKNVPCTNNDGPKINIYGMINATKPILADVILVLSGSLPAIPAGACDEEARSEPAESVRL